jgi:hypothetical protein
VGQLNILECALVLTKARPPTGLFHFRLCISTSCLPSTDDLTLNRAVGHIGGTAAPGEEGNIGIAGHRDGFCRGLKDVHLGEYLDLYTERGKHALHRGRDPRRSIGGRFSTCATPKIFHHTRDLLSVLFRGKRPRALHRSRLNNEGNQSQGT